MCGYTAELKLMLAVIMYKNKRLRFRWTPPFLHAPLLPC